MDDKRWFKSYDPGVPHTLQPYPHHTLVDILCDTARQRPNHPALLFQGQSISYSELDRLSTAFAAGLMSLGFKPGERVVLLLPNTPQIILSMFGIWKAGGIAVPLNPLYTESELERAIRDCGAETVVVLTPFYGKVKAIQSRLPIRTVIATNIKEYLPALTQILFTLLKEKKDGHRISLQSGDIWLGSLLHQNRNAPRWFIRYNRPTQPFCFSRAAPRVYPRPPSAHTKPSSWLDCSCTLGSKIC